MKSAQQLAEEIIEDLPECECGSREHYEEIFCCQKCFKKQIVQALESYSSERVKEFRDNFLCGDLKYCSDVCGKLQQENSRLKAELQQWENYEPDPKEVKKLKEENSRLRTALGESKSIIKILWDLDDYGWDELTSKKTKEIRIRVEKALNEGRG